MKILLSVAIGFACLGLGVGLLHGAPMFGQGDLAKCKSVYDGAIRRMDGGELGSALKDFDQVVTGCSAASTDLVAEARLRRGEIYLAQRNIAAANAELQQMPQQYWQRPAINAGMNILSGRIFLTENRSPDGLASARDGFIRAEKLAPIGSDRSAEAVYYLAETLRLAHGHEEALAGYRALILRFPSSIWAARALLGSARCYSRNGDWVSAMAALELVQRKFAASKEADTALNWSTVLYRLHVRTADPPFEFSGRKIWDPELDFDSGVGMAFDNRGRLLVAHRNGWSLLGEKTERVKADRAKLFLPTAAAVTSDGTVVVVYDDFLVVQTLKPSKFALLIPQPAKPAQAAKVRDLVPTWNDKWLMADERTKTIRMAPRGFDALLPYFELAATNLAVNDIDDLAVLDGDRRTVTVIDRDRDKAKIKEIASQGDGWKFSEPIDIAFDELGDLYVLDKGTRSVAIFDSAFKFVRTFQLPRNGEGAIKNLSVMALDPAGRLFLLGDDVAGKRRVLVYQ